MIKVHLNSGTLYKFKKGKVTFGKEHLYITYDNITYQKELKNVHKVVEKIMGEINMKIENEIASILIHLDFLSI